MQVSSLLLLGLFLGYIFGIITGIFFNKNNFSTEKIVSLLLAATWLALHIIGFFQNQNLPVFLDLIGGGAIGNLAGLNIPSLIKSFRGKI